MDGGETLLPLALYCLIQTLADPPHYQLQHLEKTGPSYHLGNIVELTLSLGAGEIALKM